MDFYIQINKPDNGDDVTSFGRRGYILSVECMRQRNLGHRIFLLMKSINNSQNTISRDFVEYDNYYGGKLSYLVGCYDAVFARVTSDMYVILDFEDSYSMDPFNFVKQQYESYLLKGTYSVNKINEMLKGTLKIPDLVKT